MCQNTSNCGIKSGEHINFHCNVLLVHSKTFSDRDKGRKMATSAFFSLSMFHTSSECWCLIPAIPDCVPFSISSSPAGIYLDHYSIYPACANEISTRAKISAKSFIKSPEKNRAKSGKDKVGGRLEPQESANSEAARPAGEGGRPGAWWPGDTA